MPGQNVRVKHRIRRGLNPLVVILLVAGLFSAIVAGVWQMQTPPEEAQSLPMLDLPPSSGTTAGGAVSTPSPPAVSVGGSASAVVPPAGSAPVSSTVESAAALPAAAQPGGEVPKRERVGSDYFDDAAFVGDSITTGIKLYEVMSNASVYAATGINLDNIFTKPVISAGEDKKTIPDALAQANPGKIYVMIGANSLGNYDDHAIKQYGKLIDLLKTQHPNSVIYVQSVLPLYEPTFAVKYGKNITNVQIDAFNTGLRALVQEKQVYYLDVASAFKDAGGAMPAEYTPDGIHINAAQYVQWFDFLKTHAIGQ